MLFFKMLLCKKQNLFYLGLNKSEWERLVELELMYWKWLFQYDK